MAFSHTYSTHHPVMWLPEVVRKMTQILASILTKAGSKFRKCEKSRHYHVRTHTHTHTHTHTFGECYYWNMIPPCPFLLSFLLSSWRCVRSYWPYLEVRDLIWGNDWSHWPFIRRSPSWGFPGFTSAARQMLGDMCAAPRIITDVTDVTLGQVAFGQELGQELVAPPH